MAAYSMTDDSQRRFDIAEKTVAVPPALQRGHQSDAACSPFASRYLAYRRPLRFGSIDPKSRCDTYFLSPWMVMAVVDVASSGGFESPLHGQNIVEFHYRVSGAIEIGGSWGECRLADPAWLLWFQPQGCNDATERLGGAARARETWVSLYCDRDWLHEVNEQAATMVDRAICEPDVAERKTPHFRVGRHFAQTIPLLRDIVGAKREDPLHWLYASAKANELLYVTLSNLPHCEVQSRLKLSSRERRELQAVREILAHSLAEPPRLPALARRAGMNCSKLCGGFRQLFGETMTEFVRRRRLEFAHELLRTSDLQIQQIATRAGYAHHCSFTVAFTRHFGYSPKAVCRVQRFG